VIIYRLLGIALALLSIYLLVSEFRRENGRDSIDKINRARLIGGSIGLLLLGLFLALKGELQW